MTSSLNRLGAVAAVSLAMSAGALAAPPRAPSIDQSLEMQSVSAPALSPDGRRIVYQQTRTNWETNAIETDLWLADRATGARHRLTFAAKSSTDAAWSPDGNWIAFLSDRPGILAKSPEGKRQLYVMAADGGEAQQLTRLEKGVERFDWAPDSRRLALASAEPDDKVAKDRKDAFGDYHVFHADYDMVRLYLISLPTPDASGRASPLEEPKLLTAKASFSVGGVAFSPDGETLAFSAQRDPDLISGDTSRIYTLDLKTDQVTQVVGGDAPATHPQWSPDGTRIAFVTTADAKHFFFANHVLAVVPRAGGLPRLVTAGFDEDADLLRWGPQGLYFQALQKTRAGLFIANPDTGLVKPVSLPGAEIARAFSFSRAFDSASFVATAPNHYAEIDVSNLAKPNPVQLTHVGDQVAPFDTALREVVQWTSGDGTAVEGVLYKPRDFDPKRTYPLLVVIHGGPTGVDVPAVAPDRYYPVERFVAKGALVLRPNYRGSAGYGARFRSLNVRDLGVGDYADVIAGVDSLIAKGFVDKGRVASMGWSEGGYISAFITTSSDRFQAVSVGAGISDWTTYYVGTDITPFTRQYLGAAPWDDPAIYARTSPITYVAKARTPTLIQHGGADRRVPLANAYELRQALEDHGVPVKMVVYDGFGHPIDKPKQQRAVMEENEAWFDHYIWGEPLAPALAPRASEAKADGKVATP